MPLTPDADAPSQGRARPLPPDERRAALIAATLPLIKAHGADVSTRQIAAAAGVAEGTIFRAFPDKDSLVRAAVDSALDTASVVASLSAIDSAAPLDQRLVDAVRIVQDWLTSVIRLMMALHGDSSHRAATRRRPRHDAIKDAIERMVEPDRHRLRVPPAEVARLLRLLVFSNSHPVIAEGEPFGAEEIVGVLLDGVRDRAGGASC